MGHHGDRQLRWSSHLPMGTQGECINTDGVALRAHDDCRAHRRYMITCEQYDGLLAECGNRCATCRLPAADNGMAGKLFIDHDYAFGMWAVRGLLCGSCNAELRTDRPDPEWARHYLDNAWYKRMLASLNLSPTCPPEPNRGTAIRDFEGRVWRWRQKTRYKPYHEGWHPGHAASTPVSWWDLYRRFGPHNLTPVNGTQGIGTPRFANAEDMSDGEAANRIRAALNIIATRQWCDANEPHIHELLDVLGAQSIPSEDVA